MQRKERLSFAFQKAELAFSLYRSLQRTLNSGLEIETKA